MTKIFFILLTNFFVSCKFISYTTLLFTEEFFLGLPFPLVALGVALALDFLTGPPLDILSSLYNLSVTACATGVNGLPIVCISKSFFFCLPLTVSCASLSSPFCFLSQILLLNLLLISVRLFFTFCGFGTC